MSSVALIQLIGWSDNSLGPLWMTFIWFVTYSVVRCSVGWKPPVVDVLNLLLNLIRSPWSMWSVKLTSSTSCAPCVSCMSCIAGRAAKSEHSCDVSESPAVHRLQDTPSTVAIVRCVVVASDAFEAVRIRVLLPMWANSLSVCMEVNIIDDQATVSLELTTTRAYHRAAPLQGHSRPPTTAVRIWRQVSRRAAQRFQLLLMSAADPHRGLSCWNI